MTREVFIMMGLLMAAAAVGAQEKPAEGAKAPPAEIKEADVDRMNEAATPGPMHQWLAQLAGDWKYESTMWTAPGVPPTVMGGDCDKKMTFGGRFLEEFHRGTSMGKVAEGRNVTGWDNLQKQFVGNWIDNASTGIIETRGRLEADGKTMTLESEYLNPMNERREKLRLIYRIKDADHHSFEYWVKGVKGAADHKFMEIRYTRKGKA